ncbi:MAG TPA: MBL fold metallo-hydrolase [Solirubrobacteraceae bacterium]|nr:MBL fold metallo-hydrolase [Solirubrobacteraceae bacterium]
MREVGRGIWWWEAVHPEWTAADAESEGWGPQVSSYAVDDGSHLLLLDPTTPPEPVAALAGERETTIVLTCPWHARDTAQLAEKLGCRVLAPDPDSPQAREVADETFAAGDELPLGIEVFPGMEPNDLVLWLPDQALLVAGDTLIDRGGGLEFPADWADKGMPAAQILASLQPLLELPVKFVLPTHGAPTDGAGLREALAGA